MNGLFPLVSAWLGMAAFGLCLGSFATALIYRMPRSIPWIVDKRDTGDQPARSACPHCNHALGARDLVPLFSWMAARGRCRYCSHPVSVRYPLTELAAAALTLLLFFAWGFSLPAAPLYLAVPFLLAAIIIDWDYMILPDDINASLFLLALAHVLLMVFEAGWDWAGAVERIVAMLVLVGAFALASFILSQWKGRSALGMGDLKFLTPAGLFMGLAAIPSFMALSGLLGIATAACRGTRGEAFPFGPALIISLYVHLFLTGLGFDYTW